MPWLPISESNLSYVFNGAAADLDGPVAHVASTASASWTLTVTQTPVQFRVTPLIYQAVGAIGQPARFGVAYDAVAVYQPNTNGDTEFTPAPFVLEGNDPTFGTTTLGYNPSTNVSAPVETYAFHIEVFVIPTEPDKQLGITTVANVSGYDRSRVHQSNLYAQEKRRLVANFNGALPKGALIETARWDTWGLPQIKMSDGLIADDQRSTSVMIGSQFGGAAIIKCTVTMDDGSIMTQNFRVNVQYAPIYGNEVWTTGPTSITITVP